MEEKVQLNRQKKNHKQAVWHFMYIHKIHYYILHFPLFIPRYKKVHDDVWNICFINIYSFTCTVKVWNAVSDT